MPSHGSAWAWSSASSGSAASSAAARPGCDAAPAERFSEADVLVCTAFPVAPGRGDQSVGTLAHLLSSSVGVFVPARAEDQAVVTHDPGVFHCVLASGEIAEDVIDPAALVGNAEDHVAEAVAGRIDADVAAQVLAQHVLVGMADRDAILEDEEVPLAVDTVGGVEKGEGGLAALGIVAREGLLHEPVGIGAGLGLGGGGAAAGAGAGAGSSISARMATINAARTRAAVVPIVIRRAISCSSSPSSAGEAGGVDRRAPTIARRCLQIAHRGYVLDQGRGEHLRRARHAGLPRLRPRVRGALDHLRDAVGIDHRGRAAGLRKLSTRWLGIRCTGLRPSGESSANDRCGRIAL